MNSIRFPNVPIHDATLHLGVMSSPPSGDSSSVFVFHDVGTFEEYLLAVSVESPPMWVCLLFAYD